MTDRQITGTTLAECEAQLRPGERIIHTAVSRVTGHVVCLVDRPSDSRVDAPDLPVGYVLEAKTGGYLVQSRTTAGVWYLVFGRSCSCAAGQHGDERCWHRKQVAAFVDAINAEKRRPSAPANVSALVD